jgi:hypothetical protein
MAGRQHRRGLDPYFLAFAAFFEPTYSESQAELAADGSQ